MNRLIIYIITAFVAIAGTFIANKIQLRKATKPLNRHIEALQSDSVITHKKAVFYMGSDSLKAFQISEMQLTLQVLAKENRILKKEVNELANWKLDAQDGVILKTDTVRVGIFGKIKRRK